MIGYIFQVCNIMRTLDFIAPNCSNNTNHVIEYKQPFTVPREMIAGSLACMIASIITNPLDVLRVRHQMIYSMKLSANNSSIASIISVRATLKHIISDSGWRGIFLPGIQAIMIREAFYSSIRFGLYTKIKDCIYYTRQNISFVSKQTDIHKLAKPLTFVDKLLAGILTGSIGSAISSPIDLVKIRMQYEYGLIQNGIYTSGPMKGKQPTYSSTIKAFHSIWKHEGGLKALFRGVNATITRAGLLTGGQLASYESAKSYFKSHQSLEHFHEGPLLHIICSIWSGIIAATFCAPADIVKTRLMCDRTLAATLDVKQKYKNSLDCLYKVIRNEGLFGLFKGWLPSYFRLAPHFIISLPLNEWFRTKLGVGTL